MPTSGSPVLHASPPPSACACLPSPVLANPLCQAGVQRKAGWPEPCWSPLPLSVGWREKPAPATQFRFLPLMPWLTSLTGLLWPTTHSSNKLRSLEQQTSCGTGWNKDPSPPPGSHWLPAMNTGRVQIPECVIQGPSPGALGSPPCSSAPSILLGDPFLIGQPCLTDDPARHSWAPTAPWAGEAAPPVSSPSRGAEGKPRAQAQVQGQGPATGCSDTCQGELGWPGVESPYSTRTFLGTSPQPQHPVSTTQDLHGHLE